MNIIHDLASKYGDATKNTQQIINGALHFQQNKGNKEYLVLLEQERSLISLYNQIQELVYNTKEYLPKALRETELPQTKNAIKNAIADQEDRISEYSNIYRKAITTLLPIAKRYEYQLFTKAI